MILDVGLYSFIGKYKEISLIFPIHKRDAILPDMVLFVACVIIASIQIEINIREGDN